MAGALWAPGVTMPVLMWQVRDDAWTKNPEDAQKTFDLSAYKGKTVLIVNKSDILESAAAAATIKVSVRWTDIRVANTVSAAVVPTLTDIIQSGQRNLPIEDRIPGPIVQERLFSPITAP